MARAPRPWCQPWGGGALDEPAGGGALVFGTPFCLAGAGALVLNVADGQPQQLDHRVVVGEVPAVLMILRSW